MSDDLMRRLCSLHKHATVGRSPFYVGSCAEDAMHRIEELEAKLAKAVEAERGACAEAPEWIFATGNSTTGSWNSKKVTFKGPLETKYIRADLVQAAVADALTKAAECCTAELRNTAMLMSNPPKSSAAWDARNAILNLLAELKGQ